MNSNFNDIINNEKQLNLNNGIKPEKVIEKT